MERVLVTGGLGFIGHHLANKLKARGHWVRCVDIRPLRKGMSIKVDEIVLLDLREPRNATLVTMGIDWVFGLAASMGGAGYVFTGLNDVEITRDNALINVNMLEAARRCGVKRYFLSSSACIYPRELQLATTGIPLGEEMAYPANPDSPYGFEKIYAEQLCGAYARETGMKVRIARFFNIMGEECAWNNGREKAPAAASRKIAYAKLADNPTVDVWGTGKQFRSFCHVDDLTEAVLRLMESDYDKPVNIGTDRCVTIDDIYEMVAEIAEIEVELNHIPGPIGVDVRIPDLTVMRKILDFEPRVSLRDGLARVYGWVEKQVEDELNSDENSVYEASLRP